MRKVAFLSFAAVMSSAALAQTYSNPASMLVPPTGTGGQLDFNSTTISTITVSGAGPILLSMTVDFFNISGTFPDDMDAMLVSPGGLRTILFSDSGGGSDISGVNLNISDTAAGPLPDATIWISGSYRPTNYGTGDTWYDSSGLVTPATTTSLATFAGIDPNGTWTLYIRDDAAGDVHTFAGGWALNLTAVPEPATFAVLGLGAAALLRRRKARKA